MSFEERLAEAVGPEPDYSTIPEELWKTYKGARVFYEVHFRLSETESPETHQRFKDLMNRFMWGEGTVIEHQDELRQIFANQPELKQKFSGFLEAPTSSEAEQAAAKAQLCDLLGTITQKRDPNRPSIDESNAFISDIQKRFEDQPEIAEEIMHLGVKVLSSNTEEREVIRTKVAELLKGHPDLLEQLDNHWYGYKK